MKLHLPSPQRRAELALVLLALIWGVTFLLVKNALPDVSTMLFLALRFGIASLLVGICFLPRLCHWEQLRRELRGGVLAGAALFAGYALQTAGLRYTTASKSAFITGLYIVLVPLMGALLCRRSVREEMAGVAVALAGLALLTLEPGSGAMNLGDLLTAGCAAAFAAHILLVEHFSRRVRFESLGLLQIATVALLSALAMPWVEQPRLVWSRAVWVALAVTAVFATAAAFALYSWAQQHTTATRAALIFILEPVFAGLTGWWFAGERMTPRMLVGSALILAAILWTELKPRTERLHLSG